MVICAELFIAKMDAMGVNYNVKETDDRVIISVPFSGTITNVILDNDDNGTHPALRTVFEHCPEDKMADVLFVCNQMNMRFRWVKFYVDNDSDIMIEDDAIVSPENAGDELLELVYRTATIIKEAKPMIMRAIYS